MFEAKYKKLFQNMKDIFRLKDVSICSTMFELLWKDAFNRLHKPGFQIELPNIL